MFFKVMELRGFDNTEQLELIQRVVLIDDIYKRAQKDKFEWDRKKAASKAKIDNGRDYG